MYIYSSSSSSSSSRINILLASFDRSLLGSIDHKKSRVAISVREIWERAQGKDIYECSESR